MTIWVHGYKKSPHDSFYFLFNCEMATIETRAAARIANSPLVWLKMARNPSEILEPSYKLPNECGARPDLGGPLEYDCRLEKN